MNFAELKDPLKLGKLLWPDVSFYKEQREIIRSVWENDETMAPAGNMLGKDFVAGFILLTFFLTRTPCRVISTSVDHNQLAGVLWGEVRRFIQTSRFPLEVERGGPLVVNHLHLRKVDKHGEIDGLSYAIGRVAAKGEGMLGHHIADVGDGVPRTLFMADEASGVDDMSYERADTWARRKFIIGNPYPCENFFKRGVKAGDLLAPDKSRYYRKVIRIRAVDSPNVQWALKEKAAGQKPSGKMLVPGVLPYADYEKRRATWDTVRQSIGLDAEFWEGGEILLFPPVRLNQAEALADTLVRRARKAKGIGVDPAQGGDMTSMVAVDELGVLEQVSRKTPDTSVVTGEVLAFMRKHGAAPEDVVFDAGGGGKEHADRLRSQGYRVRAVGFGEAVTLELKRGLYPLEERRDLRHEKYVYVNRRSQMYGEAAELFDTAANPRGFALPAEFAELRRQLSLMPKQFDKEGRMKLPPKNRATKNSIEPSLTDIIGHSPDEADAFVLAVHGMLHRSKRLTAGAI